MKHSFDRRTWVWVVVLGMLSGIPAPSNAATTGKRIQGEGFSYTLDPRHPDWVSPVPAGGARVDAAAAQVENIDVQTRVTDNETWRYTRLVTRVNAPAGLPMVSQIQVEYEPSYQSLILHRLEIVRNGRSLDRLGTTDLKLLQREQQLEQSMYNGLITLSGVIQDVRVGDRILFEYSVRGVNPVFQGRYSSMEWLASPLGPTQRIDIRILMPGNRALQSQVGPRDTQVQQRRLGGQLEYRFSRDAVPALVFPQQVDPSEFVGLMVQVSEFRNWNDVAQWGEKLFPVDHGVAALDGIAQSIRTSSVDDFDRTTKALDFVQQEIRYFGTQLGPNSHRPFSPAKVLQQRFGDCKDKTLLLLSLLKRLGIAGEPVLVSTVQRDFVSDLLPSPLVFDHVIARVELQGRVFWLDATRSLQTGALSRRSAFGFGSGLLLRGDQQALTSIPLGTDEVQVSVVDRFIQTRWTEAPILESEVRFRAAMAERMRLTEAMAGSEQLQNMINQSYLQHYPTLLSLGPPETENAADDDAFIVRQRFSVPEFWSYPQVPVLVTELVHWSLIDALRFPADPQRKFAYFQGAPGIYRHTIEIRLPEAVLNEDKAAPTNRVHREFELRTDNRTTGNRTQMNARLKLKAHRVPVQAWARYSSTVQSTAEHFGLKLVVPAAAPGALEDQALAKAQDRGLRGRRVRARTDTQEGALLDVTTRTILIEGGRLTAGLKASALRERAVALDKLGLLDLGWQDFEAALTLGPGDEATLQEALVNAMARLDMNAVRTLEARIKRENPDGWDADAQAALGKALYMTGDYDAALDQLGRAVRSLGAYGGEYPALFLALAAQARGQDARAVIQGLSADELGPWQAALLRTLLEKRTDQSLLSTAQSQGNRAEALCEAYFYLGERARAAGDMKTARQYFQKSTQQDVTEFTENHFARYRLRER